MVEVLIGDEHSYIRLIGGRRNHTRDIAVAVETYAGGFAGRNHEVWFFPDEAVRFLLQLTDLESLRRGQATLESMYPDELRLAILIVDRAGHAAVTIQLRRYGYLLDNRFDDYVQTTFALDPTSLPRVLSDFRELFKEQE